MSSPSVATPRPDYSEVIATSWPDAVAAAQDFADTFREPCYVIALDPNSPLGRKGLKYGHMLARELPTGAPPQTVLHTARPLNLSLRETTRRVMEALGDSDHEVSMGVLDANLKRLDRRAVR